MIYTLLETTCSTEYKIKEISLVS